MRAVSFFVLALAMIGCGPGVRDGDDTSGDDDPTAPDADETPVETGQCAAMDIVFVVDDSGSMQEEQTNLATNFPMFADVLMNYEVGPGQPLDFRAAVTTTGRDLTTIINTPPLPPIQMTENGDNGAFRDTCGVSRRWLERTDTNMASTLACRANVGTSGSGTEMPMYASMLALGERVADGTNAGFLRDDALLAVVMLTDEDDCSRTDNNITIDAMNPQGMCGPNPAQVMPSQAVAFLDQVKGGERGRWASAVIAGPTNCSSAFGDAAEAVRLKEFVQIANSNGQNQNALFASICEGNLAPALQQALDTFQAACESFPPIE
jgi:hypothetical protein